jgi:hypothetical protein
MDISKFDGFLWNFSLKSWLWQKNCKSVKKDIVFIDQWIMRSGFCVHDYGESHLKVQPSAQTRGADAKLESRTAALKVAWRAPQVYMLHITETHIHIACRGTCRRESPSLRCQSVVCWETLHALWNTDVPLQGAKYQIKHARRHSPLLVSHFIPGGKKCSGSQWGAPLLSTARSFWSSDGKTITFVRWNTNEVKIRPKGAHFNEIMKLIDIILFAFVWLAIQAMWTRRLNYSNWISSPRLSAS